MNALQDTERDLVRLQRGQHPGNCVSDVGHLDRMALMNARHCGRNRNVVRGHASQVLESLKLCSDILLGGAVSSEAGEFNPGRSIGLDQDPEAVYFLVKQTWMEWDLFKQRYTSVAKLFKF